MDGLLVEAVQAVVHTFADLHKKELGGKEEAESYSLVAGTPSTSIDLLEAFVFRKTVFFALFQKGSL